MASSITDDKYKAVEPKVSDENADKKPIVEGTKNEKIHHQRKMPPSRKPHQADEGEGS